MKLEDAIEVFMGGISFVRSYTHPYGIERFGTCSVMRDAPGRKRDPRLEEYIAWHSTPRAINRTVARVTRGRHVISYMRSSAEAAGPVKDGFSALGYRLFWTEQFFVHSLGRIAPVAHPYPVSRVIDLDEAQKLAKAAKARQILPAHLSMTDPPIRQYVAKDGEKFAGMVKSIRVGEANWCSALLVWPEYRRRGIGRALMTQMLLDDREHGSQGNVLLASAAGAKLYPQLGYESIGELMLFRVAKSARGGR